MTTHDQTTEVKATLQKIVKGIDRIFEKTEKEKLWKDCPSCGEQWVKLRGCRVEKSWSYVCVECAESLKGWEWIMKTYPIEKPFENWPDDWFTSYSFFPEKTTTHVMVGDDKVVVYKNLRAKIKFWIGKREKNEEPAYHWDLYTMTDGFVLYNKKEFLAHFDNALEAWFRIQVKVLEFARNAEPKEDPTEPKKFRRV